MQNTHAKNTGSKTIRAKSLKTSLRSPKAKTPKQQSPWAHSGIEPHLQDLLNDPISDLLRARDGISISQICTVVRQARDHLQMRNGSAYPPGTACA